MRSITIESIRIHLISLPLVEILTTSFGGEANKSAMLLELRTSDGLVGWGESSAMLEPGYSYETLGSSYHIIREFLIPAVLDKTVTSPTELPALMNLCAAIRSPSMRLKRLSGMSGHKRMICAWRMPSPIIYRAGHESRGYANVGVSIGIKSSHEETIATIGKRLAQGYGRIKLKIRPGWDIEMASAVRAAFPISRSCWTRIAPIRWMTPPTSHRQMSWIC